MFVRLYFSNINLVRRTKFNLSFRFFYSILICLICLCYANICEAQFRISGKLIENITNKPISSATVTMKYKSSDLVLAYDISDKNGEFKLDFKNRPNSQVWLFVTAIGFHMDSALVKNQFEGLLFRLIPYSKPLPPVTVKNRTSFLSIKPDTSSYATEAFTQKQDRTIEDVLKKIPGIEISESGRISYNGRAISNFYIDGDDIVSDRYSIATKSIRPDMVEKIQLIENHNPIRALESAILSNNTAVNLRLREEARLAVMGNVGAGGGDHETYKMDVDLFSFKKQFKFINQIKLNNAGIDITTDILPQNLDELVKKLEQGSTKPYLSMGAVSSPDIAQQRYLFNRTGMLTTNNSFMVKPETQIKLNVQYFEDEKKLTSNLYSVFILPTNNFVYNEQKEQQNSLKKLNAQFAVTLNQKKNI